MESLIREHGFAIPPFASWTAGEWEKAGHEYDEIRDNCLGWDITDYGLDNFDKIGFALLTIRNGNHIYITVYNGAEDGSMLDTDVTVHMDGKTDIVPAGTKNGVEIRSLRRRDFSGSRWITENGFMPEPVV